MARGSIDRNHMATALTSPHPVGYGSIRPMFVLVLAGRRAFRMYGMLCCKHCAVRRGAVYASQQK